MDNQRYGHTNMDIEKFLSYQFQNPKLLKQALTHKSFAYEQKGIEDNERLEFLGDAVLELAITDILIQAFPKESEGELSKRRAYLVSEDHLASIARQLKVQDFLYLGRGEETTGGKNKPRLLASALEAIIGGIYLDSDFVRSCQFVKEIFNKEWVNISYEKDFKSQLQEKTQRLYQSVPEYVLIQSEGPDHNKTFYIDVLVNGKKIAEGCSKSKKEAQQIAAQKALAYLNKIRSS